jgi:hypothetical protein
MRELFEKASVLFQHSANSLSAFAMELSSISTVVASAVVSADPLPVCDPDSDVGSSPVALDCC